MDAFLKPYGREMSLNAKEVTGSAQLTEAVCNDPTGIGNVGFYFHRDSRLVEISADSGIVSQPGSFGAKTEKYPLQRTLYTYNWLPGNLPPPA